MRFDIVAIGEPMVEFNQTTAGEPGYLQGFGGDTSNMIIAAARSGARAGYLTRLGDDSFGQSFMELWRSEGIDTQAVKIDSSAHTGVYFVHHDASGHHFSYLRAGSAASRMTPDDVPAGLLAASAIVHASGISMAISASACDTVLEAFATARSAGSTVAFDSNLRLKLWPMPRARALIAAAVSLSDLFFPSLEDAAALSGQDDPETIIKWCHALGAKVVFLKLGPKGVIVSDGVRREHISGHQVATLDATGAGDCFCGAALARIAAGDSIWDAARYANAAAALACTGFGAVAPLPRGDQVRTLLSGSRA